MSRGNYYVLEWSSILQWLLPYFPEIVIPCKNLRCLIGCPLDVTKGEDFVFAVNNKVCHIIVMSVDFGVR